MMAFNIVHFSVFSNYTLIVQRYTTPVLCNCMLFLVNLALIVFPSLDSKLEFPSPVSHLSAAGLK